MTSVSIATPSKKMLSIQPVQSLFSRLHRRVTTGETETDPSTRPREPTSPPPTGDSSPEPLSNNQNSPTSREAARVHAHDLMAKNPKLPGSVVDYLNSEKYLDKLMVLKQIVKTGATPTSSRESLAASMASLGRAEDLIVLVYQNQLKVQQKEQSNGDTLVAKLKDIGWWQDAYRALFTSSTILSGYVAFTCGQVIAGKLVGGSAAAAAIAFLWVGKRVDSHEDELKKAVKKCKGISNAISVANKLEQGCLEEIMALVGGLKSDNQSIQAMMMSPEAAQLYDVIFDKIVALHLGFGRLLTKVDCCITDAKSVREGVIHTVVKNLG